MSKYKTLLAFVSGAMVGSSRSNDDQSVSLTQDDVELDSGHCKNIGIDANDWIELGFSSNFNRGSIPSMKSVAEMVSNKRGITLDQIQYIAYEIICSSFLLNLLNESSRKNPDLSSDFATNDEELDDQPINNIKAKLIDNLKKIGAKDQLLMFVMGPAEKYSD